MILWKYSQGPRLLIKIKIIQKVYFIFMEIWLSVKGYQCSLDIIFLLPGIYNVLVVQYKEIFARILHGQRHSEREGNQGAVLLCSLPAVQLLLQSCPVCSPLSSPHRENIASSLGRIQGRGHGRMPGTSQLWPADLSPPWSSSRFQPENTEIK